MRLFGLPLLVACLCACGNAPEARQSDRHGGRYVGIGIYNSGEMWQRIVAASRSEDRGAATLRDDEQVIVVVDSRTGEVRQCGNLSGHCIRMNPWSGQQAVPVSLTEHAADIDTAENAASEAEPAANAH